MPRRAPVAWDTSPRSGPGQALLVTLAGLALAPALLFTVLRLVPPSDDGTALVASFIPYGLVGYVLAFLLLVVALLRARRRFGLGMVAGLVAALAALQATWLAPFFVPDHRPATTRSFTLLSLNEYDGHADPRQIATEARQADLVVLVEVTPDSLAALKPYGWDHRFPYSVGDRKDGISDTAIFSRFPLTRGTPVGRTSFEQWVTTVSVPQVGAVRLIAAHPCNPYCGYGRFAAEHAQLETAVRANLGAPLVVAGDFNAVDDHGAMQSLRRLGMESATDIVGAGWLPTYPANRRLLPPLLPIDHVLVDDALTATSIRTVAIAGTDHRGLLTVLAGAR